MPVTRICEQCGKIYQSKPSIRKKFCCMACYNAFRRANRKNHAVKTEKRVDCLYCGKAFRPTRRKQKYCSSKCAHAARRKRVVKTCPTCKRKFEVTPSRRSQVYCSQACRRGKKMGRRHHNRPAVVVHCAYCQREFKVKPSRIEKSKSGRVYCSRKCATQYRVTKLALNAQCLYCGKRFHRSPSELARGFNTYCSRTCYCFAQNELRVLGLEIK